MKKVDEILIEELNFSYRTQHYMDYKKIKTLGELKKYSLEDLYKIRKTPRKVAMDIVAKHAEADEYGIEFQSDNKKE